MAGGTFLRGAWVAIDSSYGTRGSSVGRRRRPAGGRALTQGGRACRDPGDRVLLTRRGAADRQQLPDEGGFGRAPSPAGGWSGPDPGWSSLSRPLAVGFSSPAAGLPADSTYGDRGLPVGRRCRPSHRRAPARVVELVETLGDGFSSPAASVSAAGRAPSPARRFLRETPSHLQKRACDRFPSGSNRHMI